MAADDNVHEGDGDPDGDDADGSSHGSRTLTTFISAQRGRAMSPEQQIRKECGFSQGISTISKPTRLQITRAYLADAFAVAFDLALYTLCTDLMGRGYRECPLDLARHRDAAAQHAQRSGRHTGRPAAHFREAVLDTVWLELPPAQGFAALSALLAETKQHLFAWCVGLMLKPQLAIEDGADPVIDEAGRRLAIPFADRWRPDAPITGGGSRRRMRSMSRRTFSSLAGRAIMSSTRSRSSPRRYRRRSIPMSAPPQFISKRYAIKPPHGCRPASRMPKPLSTLSPLR